MTLKTAAQARAFLKRHRLVTLSSQVEGVPCFTQAVTGELIKGSWWGHPQGKLIFSLAEGLEASDQWAQWAEQHGVEPGKMGFEAAREALTPTRR